MEKLLGTIKRTASGWSVTQVSMLLTLTAVALWAYSLVQVRLEIGHYGLISSFPVVYFVALGILTLAAVILWVSPEKHQKLLFLQLMALIAAVWLIPMLIGTRPYFQDAYGILTWLRYIAVEGRLLVNPGGYLDWPGAFLLFSMLGQLGSTSLDSVMNVSSFIMILLYLPPLYVFLRNVLGEARTNFCWAGLWIFSLANWIPEGYFSPQGVSYLLFLLMLALVTSSGFWKKNQRWLPLTISVVVVGAALVVTHFLASVMAVGTLMTVAVAKRSLRAVPAIVAVVALAVLWNVAANGRVGSELAARPLLATPSTVSSGGEARAGLLDFDLARMVEQQVLEPASRGSQSHVDVARVRVIFSALVAALAAAGIIYLLAKRERRTALLLLAIAAVPFLLLPIGAGIYGEAYSPRLYFFLAPVMACAATFPLIMRKRLAVPFFWVICTAAIPLTLIAQHGNQAIDHWSPSYIDGAKYVTPIRNALNYPLAELNQVALSGDRVVVDSGLLANGYYLPISRRDDALHTFKYDRPEFVDGIQTWLNVSGEYNRIYINPDYSLYLSHGDD